MGIEPTLDGFSAQHRIWSPGGPPVTLALPPENLTAKPQCVNTQKISAKFPKADIPDFAYLLISPGNI